MAKIKLSDDMLNLIYGKYGNPALSFDDFKRGLAGEKIGASLLAPGIPDKAISIYKKYVPQNISLDKFLEDVERNPHILDDIGGKFSSFNPKLSQAFKAQQSGNMPTDDLHAVLNDAVDWRARYDTPNVFAELYMDVITSDDDILRGAWTYTILNRKQRQELARRIIDGMDARLRLKKKAKVAYTDNKKRHLPRTEMIIMLIRDIAGKLDKNTRKTKRRGFYSSTGNAIVLNKAETFSDFIALIGHEYGHFIDFIYPNLGMLGAQIANYGGQTYQSSAKHGRLDYLLNPTEMSSRQIQRELRNRVDIVLEEQARQKPELFISSMETVIGHIKAKIAAMRLKYAKKAQDIESQDEYKALNESLSMYKLQLEQFKQNQKTGRLIKVSSGVGRE